MADFRVVLPGGHGIMASVDDQGVLSFVIAAGKDSPIRGTEMFDLMMRALKPQVDSVIGVWRRSFQGQASANLDRVNALTSSGLPLDEAIRHTWTVTRAARWGFTKVSLVGQPQGVPGRYSKMDVSIERIVGT